MALQLLFCFTRVVNLYELQMSIAKNSFGQSIKSELENENRLNFNGFLWPIIFEILQI